jgi:hypothetical protein
VKLVELNQMKQQGKELARYFVYCCEGEGYVERMDHFRLATTRLSLIEAIYSLLHYGESLSSQSKQAIQLIPRKVTELCEFIQSGEFGPVRQLHQAMIAVISTLELEKIRHTQQVLEELLDD